MRLRLSGFGAASAPLDLLRWVSVDELEVAAGFVAGLDGAPEDAAIAQAIIQLAHSFGLETVAEGVANDEQRQQLERRQCDRAAGPAFGYPDAPARITDVPPPVPDDSRPTRWRPQSARWLSLGGDGSRRGDSNP